MSILSRLLLTSLALVLLSSSTFANCGNDHYAGETNDNDYTADNDDYGSSGMTAEEANAYGPTAVAGAYALRDTIMPSQAEWAFRAAMNKLWEDHIVYTRNFIVSAAAGLPGTNDVVARLMQNQVDIGNAIKPYYGAAAGDQLTALLKDHISTAGEVVTAAKAGDDAKLADANRRWFANADAIAAFLAKANPQAWPEPAVKQMMHDHLNLTTQEATAELTGDWEGSIAAYDKVHQQILKMAGALSDGIIKQFPDRF